MDAHGGGGLTGPQMRRLEAAFLDAYRERHDLETLLYFYLELNLSDIVGDLVGLEVCVEKLLTFAKRQSWLPDLIAAAIRDRPGNTMLKRWVDEVEWVVAVSATSVQSSPPPAHQLTDTVHFDLADIRRAVTNTVRESADLVLALGVTYPEHIFIEKLCDWLAFYLGDTRRKNPLNLMPELGPVRERLRSVAKYRQDLGTANVLCVVDTRDVPVATATEFWAGVKREFIGIQHYLALVFIGHQNTTFPPGVTVLPPPKFEFYDIDSWTHEMIRLRGWPVAIAKAWADQLRDEAMNGNVLGIRDLYEAMDNSIKEICFDHSAFRRRFEGRI